MTVIIWLINVIIWLINVKVTLAGIQWILLVLMEENKLRNTFCLSRLAGEFLKSNYLFVAVGQVGGACRDVQQTILQVGQYSKREKLVDILRNIGISYVDYLLSWFWFLQKLLLEMTLRLFGMS